MRGAAAGRDAGTTEKLVIPTKVGSTPLWILACAGMTIIKVQVLTASLSHCNKSWRFDV
jgi:hypothetical protein